MLTTAQTQNRSSASGESPPPPPRIFFGRDELTEKIVGFAERLMPVALIGAGGIGKTSAALTVLHDDRVKRRFGKNRQSIRCDKFPASLTHFLRRLSNVIGAGVENPEDLATLRPFLSSKDMFIVLDNAESVLDPLGTSAQEMYAVVEELSQLSNVCLCITSRISIVPPDCKWLDVPTLSMEAAYDTFYRIYQHGERSDPVNGILKQLDFHPLSITLLATVAHHNKWDTGRLITEWGEHRVDMLQTGHNKSIAATIELSLSSLMFQELGPNARDLLGVVAFLPQGVNEKNLDWLFSAIAGRKNMFDKFCVLSLTYRSDGFITMLAPLRDHLRPKDPMSAPLLCLAKEHYFRRLLISLGPGRPGFEEAGWITSEDVNVEHLLDVFATVDPTSSDVWDACVNFMNHLYWHKPRLVVLDPKIERLPDVHPSKPQCLFYLSLLFYSAGNYGEQKRLLTHALKLQRERGDDYQVVETLRRLSDANRLVGLLKEGIQQVEEALAVSERLGDTVGQGWCLKHLALLLQKDNRLDAAEEAATRAIDLLEKGEQFQVCDCHQVLGEIYTAKAETKKAIHHFEVAIEIASFFSWLDQLFWANFLLAELFSREGRSDDAHAHLERAKPHAAGDSYLLARTAWLQATFWHKQHRLEEAESGALHALDVFEKLGAANDAEAVRELLQQIDRDARERGGLITPGA